MTRIGSVCSGYEGLGMAVQAVMGGELAWLADNDPGAAAILAHRFPTVPNLGDITTVDWSAVEPVDVLTAGFPCQDISCAGRRAGLREGTRSGLWSHVARAIAELRPPLVVIENVKELLSERADSDMEPCPWCLGDTDPESAMRALGAVLADLASLGFDAEWISVPAAGVGACHLRWRVFILAWPSADPGGERRHGWPGVLGNRRLPSLGREEGGHLGDSRSALAEDPDRAVGDQRRLAASGQAESGWPRADAGGPVGARVAADAERGAGDGGADEPLGEPDWRTPAFWHRPGAFGRYEHAVRRHERVFGRLAPVPVEPGRNGNPRLAPSFVEWMMGLPDGWVTGVPGLARKDMLKALGNGVVPQQAALALALLLERAGFTETDRSAA